MYLNDNYIFSIVIPLYNRAGRIKDTVQSVFNQNTKLPFEIIIVDDGSTDDSAKVISSFNDPRIRYIHQKNSGANTARNRGIDEAKGLYVALLDSDDTFLPNHLETAYRSLVGTKNTVSYSRIIVDRGNNNTFLKPPRSLKKNEHIAEYMLCDRGFLQTSTVVLPTELAKSVKYLEGLPYGQDTDFAIRLYDAGATFVMQEEPGAIWLDVQNNDRVSAKSSPEVRLSWLRSILPMITHKAYKGDCGWFVAKSYARNGNYSKALSLYFNAVFSGCYKPSLAAIIGLQIIFSGSLYRKIADIYVSFKQK